MDSEEFKRETDPLSNSYLSTLVIPPTKYSPLTTHSYYRNVLHYAYTNEMANEYLAGIIYQTPVTETAIQLAKQFISGKKKATGDRDNSECYEARYVSALKEALRHKARSSPAFNRALLVTRKAELKYLNASSFLGTAQSGKGRNVYGDLLGAERDRVVLDNQQYLSYIDSIRENRFKEEIYQRYLTYQLLKDRLQKLDFPQIVSPPFMVISFELDPEQRLSPEELILRYRERYSVSHKESIYQLFQQGRLDPIIQQYLSGNLKEGVELLLQQFVLARKQQRLFERYVEIKRVTGVTYPLSGKYLQLKEQLWVNYVNRRLPLEFLTTIDQEVEEKLTLVEGPQEYLPLYSEVDSQLAATEPVAFIKISDDRKSPYYHLSLEAPDMYMADGRWYPTLKHYVLERLYSPLQLKPKHDALEWILSKEGKGSPQKSSGGSPPPLSFFRDPAELEKELALVIPADYKQIYLEGINRAMQIKFGLHLLFRQLEDVPLFLQGVFFKAGVEIRGYALGFETQSLCNRLLEDENYRLADELYQPEVNAFLGEIRQVLKMLNQYKKDSPLSFSYQERKIVEAPGEKGVIIRKKAPANQIRDKFVEARLADVTEVLGLCTKYLQPPPVKVNYFEQTKGIEESGVIEVEKVQPAMLSVDLTRRVITSFFGLCGEYLSLNTLLVDFPKSFFDDVIGGIAAVCPETVYRIPSERDAFGSIDSAAFMFKQEVVQLVWIYLGILTSKLPKTSPADGKKPITPQELHTYITNIENLSAAVVVPEGATVIRAVVRILQRIRRLSRFVELSFKELELAFKILLSRTVYKGLSDDLEAGDEWFPSVYEALSEFVCEESDAKIVAGYINQLLQLPPVGAGGTEAQIRLKKKVWCRISYFATLPESK